jgi:hypothetical protein
MRKRKYTYFLELMIQAVFHMFAHLSSSDLTECYFNDMPSDSLLLLNFMWRRTNFFLISSLLQIDIFVKNNKWNY